jgi:hypothetical protein
MVAAWSGGGRVEFQLADYGGPAGPINPWTLARLSRGEVQDYSKAMGINIETRYFGRTKLGFLLPTWLLIVVTFALAIVPWLPTRYSLRTLMIATTIIAILLALVDMIIAR